MYIQVNMSNSYSIRSTKIGNSAGFRLPAEFYREHPQFAGADGWIEVLSPDTAIVRIVPPDDNDDDEEDSVMMRLFLDFALTEALRNNTLQPYTVEMSEAAHKLIDGVELEDEPEENS
jgi:antitoxin PrlF